MIELVRANSTDINTIRSLAIAIWNEHYPAIITQEQIDYMLDEWYNEATLLRQMTEQGQLFWLIQLEGANIGYIAITPNPESGAFYLNKFYVQRSARGIGAQVFLCIVEYFPEMLEMRLNVNRRNFKSVNFYFKMGFTIESCYDLPVGDRYIMDDFIMVWRKAKQDK
jgi:ribosomal protein S18 acetylase RimI-like enzyme